MLSRQVFNLLIALFILVAFAVRIPDLDRKPMHTDEAVHAFKTGELLEGHSFRYDPIDFHGPLLHYSAWISARLHGVRQYQDLQPRHLRLATVVYGSLLIAWLWALYNVLPPRALLVSAALFMISPALVYYSRYFIMETLLVFFHLGFTIAIMRYLAKPTTGWLVMGAACLGLMFATKETALLYLLAAGLGLIATLTLAPNRSTLLSRLKMAARPWQLPLFFIICALVFAIFVSAFGSHWESIITYLQGYGTHIQRGLHDNTHVKPWYYYGRLLIFSHWDQGPVWSEGLILILGTIGAVHFYRQRNSTNTPQVTAHNFLVWNTFLGILLFSLVPYKTPWNMLGFLAGMILLAGQGVLVLFQKYSAHRRRLVLAGVLFLGFGHLAWQMGAATTRYDASPLNPYVYAHTSHELERLVTGLNQVAAVDSAGFGLPIQVIAGGHDYWPLPWELRKFSQVYWWAAIDTGIAPAAVILGRMTANDRDSVEAVIAEYVYSGFAPGKKIMYTSLFEAPIALRPGVSLAAFIKYDLYNRLPVAVKSDP
ncbi:MAG: TIGR03663 family protein [Candidatus Marinimicrobia bacterium]|nr:TIGR03663 family protein [Candidatus Neomarinimicrobiota bacterium]